MHRRSKFLASALALSVALVGVVPLPAQAVFQPGQADLVTADFGTESSFPQQLTLIGDDLYFLAEDPTHGRELRRYRDGTLKVFDANVGDGNSEIDSIFPLGDGLGILAGPGETYQVGYLESETISWATNTALGFDPVGTLYGVVGNRLYLVNNGDQSQLKSMSFAVAGFDVSAEDYLLDVDGAQTPIDTFYDLRSIGNFLLAKIGFTTPGGATESFFQLDTTALTPVWQQVSDLTAEDMVIEGEVAYFSYATHEIEKYVLGGSGLTQADLIDGQLSLSLTGVNGLALDNGELFAQTTNTLHWLSPTGFISPNDENDTALATGFEWPDLSDRVAVIDGVAYLSYRDQLLGWELSQNKAWVLFESVSGFGLNFPQDITRMGKTLALQAETTDGDELVLIDTLTDSLEIVDVNTEAGNSYPLSITEFDGRLFFYLESPDTFSGAILQSFDGQEVTTVTDVNGNPLQLPYSGQRTSMVKLGGALYVYAISMSDTDPISGRQEDIGQLWRISSAEAPPVPIARSGNQSEEFLNLVLLEQSILIQTNGASFVFYPDDADPNTGTYTKITPDGIWTDQPRAFEVPYLGSSAFVIQNPPQFGQSDANTSKLGRIFETTFTTTPIDVYVNEVGNPGNLTTAEQEALQFRDLAPGHDNTVFYGVVSNLPTGWGVVAITRSGSTTTAYKVATAGSGITFRSIEKVRVDGKDQLLLWAMDSNIGNKGRVYLIDIDSGIPSHRLINSGDSAALKRGGADLLVHSDYMISDGVLIVRGYDGADQYQFLYSMTDLADPVVIANQPRSEFTLSFGQEDIAILGTHLYIEAWAPQAEVSGAHLYRYDPLSLLSAVNSTAIAQGPDSNSILGSRMLPRPSGTSTNAVLKSNYAGGASDVVMRSNTASNLNGAAFTRTGYTLSGWATSPSGSVAYQPSGSFPFTASDELYAIWTQDTVQPQPQPQPPSSSGSSGAVNQVATVSFVTNDSSAPSPMRVSAGSPVVLPKLANPGHRFLGWSESPNGLLVGEAYRPASSVSLYPRFEPLSFKVFLSLPAGAKGESSVLFSGDKELSLPIPTMKDHTFVAWVNAETGERITSDWVPTESVMLAPLFKAGTADEVVNFWRNSKLVSNTQLRKLSALVADEVLLNGRRTIVIRGFDMRNKDLARGRALNVAIKLRKLGVTDKIVLETEVGGSANKAEVFVN